MNKIIKTLTLSTFFLCSIFLLPLKAETNLNPENVNPHAENQKKRISDEQKKVAWEAKIKKKEEIEKQKIDNNSHSTNQNVPAQK